MPEDMRFPFQYDESGDVATVSGDEFYRRHILQLALLATQDVKGRSLSATDIASIRDDIGEELSSSPYIESPITIDLVESGPETFQARVTAQNFSEFEITI